MLRVADAKARVMTAHGRPKPMKMGMHTVSTPCIFHLCLTSSADHSVSAHASASAAGAESAKNQFFSELQTGLCLHRYTWLSMHNAKVLDAQLGLSGFLRRCGNAARVPERHQRRLFHGSTPFRPWLVTRGNARGVIVAVWAEVITPTRFRFCILPRIGLNHVRRVGDVGLQLPAGNCRGLVEVCAGARIGLAA